MNEFGFKNLLRGDFPAVAARFQAKIALIQFFGALTPFQNNLESRNLVRVSTPGGCGAEGTAGHSQVDEIERVPQKDQIRRMPQLSWECRCQRVCGEQSLRTLPTLLRRRGLTVLPGAKKRLATRCSEFSTKIIGAIEQQAQEMRSR